MRMRISLPVALLLCAGSVAGATDENRTRLMDPNTRFHRLFVVGNGNNAAEDANLRGERGGLLVRVTAAGNEAAGSTSRTLDTPSVDQLRQSLNATFAAARRGDLLCL